MRLEAGFNFDDGDENDYSCTDAGADDSVGGSEDSPVDEGTDGSDDDDKDGCNDVIAHRALAGAFPIVIWLAFTARTFHCLRIQDNTTTGATHSCHRSLPMNRSINKKGHPPSRILGFLQSLCHIGVVN